MIGLMPFIAVGCAILAGVGSAWSDDRQVIAVKSSNPPHLKALIENPAPKEQVRVEAEVIIPASAPKDQSLPALIFVHGGYGPLPHHQKWLGIARSMGIVTVYANHFAPRGVKDTVSNPRGVSAAAMVADALHLLRAVASHPRIDANRIAIMGSSKGGIAAYAGAWNPLRKRIAGDHKFAAHILLYPTCLYWDDKDFSWTHVLLMVGEKDNWTGVHHCVDGLKEFRDAGFDGIKTHVYAGAYHGFDKDEPAKLVEKGTRVDACRFSVGKDGMGSISKVRLDSGEAAGKAFKACVSKGPMYGGGGNVMAKATADLRAFLTKSLLK